MLIGPKTSICGSAESGFIVSIWLQCLRIIGRVLICAHVYVRVNPYEERYCNLLDIGE